MPTAETRWDIADEVTVRVKTARPLRGLRASSAMYVVFGLLAAAGPTVLLAQTTRSRAVLEHIRINRKDVQCETRAGSAEADTNLGMSTRRVATLFPALFKPAVEDQDDEGAPFFTL